MTHPTDAVFGIQHAVYVSGIYIPASSVVVTTSFNAIPQCVITLPAYPELYGMGRGDRVPVHVFILDTFATRTEDAVDGKPAAELSPEYRLFFEGVIIGFGYVNNALGRAFIIQCEGVFNILHKLFIRHIASASDLKATTTPGQAETEFVKHTFKSAFPLSMLMSSGTDGVELCKYPTKMLENAFAFIKNYEGSSKLATFYKTYFDLIKISNRVVKVPKFDEDDAYPTMRYLSKKAIMDVIRRKTEAMGQRASLYDWINGVLSQMECEFAFLNAPIANGSNIASVLVKPIFYEALPPKCNIMFRCMVESIQSNENVSEIPTRIRAEDMYSPMATMSQTANDSFQKYINVNFYPTNDYLPESQKTPDDMVDAYTTESISSEDFTGPIVRDIQAPDWWSYLDSAKMSTTEAWRKARLQMLKSLYMKLRYEGSILTVECAFNPYIVVGFPGVVFDPQDNGFGFIGLVISVEHSIHKSGAKTTVEMRFVRSLEEASEEPLKNTVEEVSKEITHVKDAMNEIYNAIIGTEAVKDFGELCSMIDDGYATYQNNPTEAYTYNARDIVTQKDFMETFLGLKASEDTVQDDYGNDLPAKYVTGDLVTSRFKGSDKIWVPDCLTKLSDIQSTEVDQYIYGYKI